MIARSTLDQEKGDSNPPQGKTEQNGSVKAKWGGMDA
jgi:hypothetical protein